MTQLIFQISQKTLVFTNLFIALSLIIFPASIISVDHVSGFIAVGIALAGTVTVIMLRTQILPFSREEKIFFFVVTLPFVSACISSVYNHTELARADRLSMFIFVIPMYIFFRHHPISEKYIWSGLVVGALITLVIAIYQVFYLSLVRANGSVYAILFGDVALTMGTLSLAGVSWFYRRKSWLIIVPALAFLASLTASALSSSRGAWVALPLFILILAGYANKHLSWQKIVLLVVLFLSAISTVYLIPETGVQSRVITTVNNLDQYLNSVEVTDPARNTSLGLRLEMWKASWFIFKNNPIFGIGWGELQAEIQTLVEQGLIYPGASNYYHAHNQFLSALAKGGLCGFLALSSILLFPLIIFFRSWRKNSHGDIHIISAGLILIIGFGSFCLTEALFERARAITFYAFYLSIFMALTLKKPDL